MKILRNGQWVEIATGPAARKAAAEERKPKPVNELDARLLRAMAADNLEEVNRIVEIQAERLANL